MGSIMHLFQTCLNCFYNVATFSFLEVSKGLITYMLYALDYKLLIDMDPHSAVVPSKSATVLVKAKTNFKN